MRAGGRAEPPAESRGMAGFLLGAASMFAVTYSTQAILPQLGRAFHVRPSQAGLTISVVILALAIGAWIWGPLSDRYGRKRSIVLAIKNSLSLICSGVISLKLMTQTSPSYPFGLQMILSRRLKRQISASP